MAEPFISTNAGGDPEVGPEIAVSLRGVTTYKQRAVIGWNHQSDTPNGLRSGKVWCWVSEHDHLQVYDENFNRSSIPGDVRFCGVANFTMVRMFHPFFARFGRVPQDMHTGDKKWCRKRYHQAIRSWRIKNSLPVDDEPDNPIQPINSSGRKRGRQVRPSVRGRGGSILRQGQRQSQIVTGQETELAGNDSTDAMAISEDDCSEDSDQPLARRLQDLTKSRTRQRNTHSDTDFDRNATQNTGRAEQDKTSRPSISEYSVKSEDDGIQLIGTHHQIIPRPASHRDRSILTPPLNPDTGQAIGRVAEPERMSIFGRGLPPQMVSGNEAVDNSNEQQLTGTIHETTASNEPTQDGHSHAIIGVRDNIMQQSGPTEEHNVAVPATTPEVEAKSIIVRTWVPCTIRPIDEVIVIDD